MATKIRFQNERGRILADVGIGTRVRMINEGDDYEAGALGTVAEYCKVGKAWVFFIYLDCNADLDERNTPISAQYGEFEVTI